MQKQEQSTARTQGNAPAELTTMLKRIGSTTFEVTVHFSESNDTMADIIRRIIEREADIDA